MTITQSISLAAVVLLLGCAKDPAPVEPPPTQEKPRATLPPGTELLSASTQRPGDPNAGYAALLNNGYVSCGVPYRLFKLLPMSQQPFEQLDGRIGRNATLPPEYTSVTTARGVEVVAANCLTCHAGQLEGKLVVGLGNSRGDFTSDPSPSLRQAVAFVTDPNEKAELQKFADRMSAIGPYTTLDTVGVNPATTLTYVLFAHREPSTLAWSNTPLVEVPAQPPTPVDVPPWWHMKKKHTMFHVAGGRGDHARFMMAASTLCVEDVAEAQQIDAYFGDIRAYISSLTPPPFPGAIDQAKAESGREVFERMCSACHGIYGDEGSYPNVLIPLAAIGTDSMLAEEALHTTEVRERFRQSFYGQGTDFSPGMGYVAPPLDGVWASGPYLHNGSVPTVAAVLESSTRPKYWRRTGDEMDRIRLGVTYEALQEGKAGEQDVALRKQIYDTTGQGYGNGGHTFGDALTAEERAAVLEYLKTL